MIEIKEQRRNKEEKKDKEEEIKRISERVKEGDRVSEGEVGIRNKEEKGKGVRVRVNNNKR